MDTTNRRPQLPALSYLDVDQSKRDGAYQSRSAGTPQSLSTAASPTYHFSAPPTPYGHAHNAPPPPPPAQPANNWPSAPPPAPTPPESRRTSEHEKDAGKPGRQSLPSISEALGVDSQAAFASTSAPPPALQPTHLPPPQPVAPSSPSTISRRSYQMDPPKGPPTSFTNTANYSHYPQYRSDPAAPHPTYPPATEPAWTTASYPPVQDSKPPLHSQTSQPAPRAAPPSFSRPREPSPPHEHAPHVPGSMGPPTTFAYGYSPYPPRYADPTPPSSVASGPAYQPSPAYATHGPTSAPRYEDRQSVAKYGDNVKRHLDFYDLEVALNEIASTSGIISDFSRRYGDRMHHTQRSGTPLSTLPGLVEVDDMVSKTRVQLDSLLKIRDVIVTQQAVYEQQAADQRLQHKVFNEASHSHQEAQPHDSEDGKNGAYTGTDTKKRRGRAAPPGRCHSCNRAETPEWRRGPDGARTLCNACGLHYAKLNRKNNGANKNANNVGSSNLRPKENMVQ